MLFRTSQWSSLFRWGKWPPSFLLMNGEVSFKDELNPKNKCEWMFDKLGKWNWTMSLDRRYVGIVWWNILINCPECLITSELSFTFDWNVLICFTDSLKKNSCKLIVKLIRNTLLNGIQTSSWFLYWHKKRMGESCARKKREKEIYGELHLN